MNTIAAVMVVGLAAASLFSALIGITNIPSTVLTLIVAVVGLIRAERKV